MSWLNHIKRLHIVTSKKGLDVDTLTSCASCVPPLGTFDLPPGRPWPRWPGRFPAPHGVGFSAALTFGIARPEEALRAARDSLQSSRELEPGKGGISVETKCCRKTDLAGVMSSQDMLSSRSARFVRQSSFLLKHTGRHCG